MASSKLISNTAAVVILFSSIMAAACLGLMSYTFATGKLPLGIQPSFGPEAEELSDIDKDILAREKMTLSRRSELHAKELFADIEVKRERVEKEADRLVELEKMLAARAGTITAREESLKAFRDRVDKMITEITPIEQANVSKIVVKMGKASPENQAKVFLELMDADEPMAARVIYLMADKATGALIDALMAMKQKLPPVTAANSKRGAVKTKAVEMSERIVKLLKMMQSLSDKEMK